MIKIKKLTRNNVGQWVNYKTDYGKVEKGIIKGWNDKFIFVVYKCGNDWDHFSDYTGCATKPEDLFFI